MFSGQQKKCSQVNDYHVMTYILHKGAAESNKCPPPNGIYCVLYRALGHNFFKSHHHHDIWSDQLKPTEECECLFSAVCHIYAVVQWQCEQPPLHLAVITALYSYLCHFFHFHTSVRHSGLIVVVWPDSRGISSRHPAYSFYMKGSSVSNMEANLYSFLHVNASHGSSTQAQDFMHSHTNTHTVSKKPGGLLCLREVTQEISRSSSHWKCFLYPPHWGGKKRERMAWFTEKKAKWGWLTCVGVTRCHGTPSKVKTEVVTG